jgi:cytoskeletal protein RodZ
MAIFDRFKRSDPSVLPEEVKQYYQSEQRQRAGVAVLLGVAALIITVLVATGLFYGGRYAYRKINKDDKQTASQQQTQTDTSKTQSGAEPAANPNTPTVLPDSTGGEGGGAPASTPAATPPAPTPTASTPKTGDTTLPHTGDEGL